MPDCTRLRDHHIAQTLPSTPLSFPNLVSIPAATSLPTRLPTPMSTMMMVAMVMMMRTLVASIPTSIAAAVWSWRCQASSAVRALLLPPLLLLLMLFVSVLESVRTDRTGYRTNDGPQKTSADFVAEEGAAGSTNQRCA